MVRPLATTLVPLIALAGALFASVAAVSRESGKPAAALYKQALGLQESFGKSGRSAVLSFIDPIQRGAPGAAALLEDDADRFFHAEEAMISAITIEPDGRHGKSVHQVIPSPSARTGGGILVETLRWIREEDGHWYVDLTYEDR